MTPFILFACLGCVEYEPGVEARVGLSLTTDAVELELAIEEARIRPCGEEGARTRWPWRRWFGSTRALAHGDASDENPRGPRIAGRAAVEVSQSATWLSRYEVGVGPWCGVELTLAPAEVLGSAFEVRNGSGSVRLIEPLQVVRVFPRTRPRTPGLLSVEFAFDGSSLGQALTDGASGRQMRSHLRQNAHVHLDWAEVSGL